MSTPNFMFMKYDMPLVCGGLGYFEDYYDLDCEFDYAVELAEEFSEGLKYHEVTVKGGYYQGFQFYVEETCEGGDLDKNSPYCIDNEDAHYWYDMCRSKVLRSAEAEKRKINKWLEKIGKMEGFEILVCGGVFSNGEAIYYKRDSAKTA